MAAPNSIPRIRFSTEGRSAREGWNAWCELFAPLFEIEPQCEPEAFWAEVDAFDLQRMMVTRMAFGGVTQRGLRSEERIRQSGLDHYGIELCLRNDGYVCEGRHGDTEIRPGDLAVFDMAQPHALTAANSESIALTLPRSLLEAHCPGVEKLHGHCLDDPGLAWLLGDHILALHRCLPHMAWDEAYAVVEATAVLAGACLARSDESLECARGVIEQSLLRRARQYIVSRLEDPLLSPATVGEAIGTSRATLYRLFQPLGGVAHSIKETRLRRVHAALRNPAEWRSISALAYRYGFVSAAHFSRAFRELYGCSPRDVREFARTKPASSLAAAGPEDIVADWLKNLQQVE